MGCMTTEAAAERVIIALRARKRAEKRHDDALAELHAAIIAGLDAGMKQAEIVRLTGYHRERIRQLAKAARENGEG